MDDDFTYYLECGCLVCNDSIDKFCNYHAENQPKLNDPLDIFLGTRDFYRNEKRDKHNEL
jgi:hypothetical protein